MALRTNNQPPSPATKAFCPLGSYAEPQGSDEGDSLPRLGWSLTCPHLDSPSPVLGWQAHGPQLHVPVLSLRAVRADPPPDPAALFQNGNLKKLSGDGKCLGNGLFEAKHPQNKVQRVGQIPFRRQMKHLSIQTLLCWPRQFLISQLLGCIWAPALVRRFSWWFRIKQGFESSTHLSLHALETLFETHRHLGMVWKPLEFLLP